MYVLGFPGGSDGKESALNVVGPASFSGSERTPGGGNGNPLQHSCLENPMHRGAWQAIVHRVTKSRTRLSIHECTLKSTDSPNNNTLFLVVVVVAIYLF